MALVASDIYKLSADQLRQLCGAERLDCGGTVQALRQRIVAHLKAGKMTTKATDEVIQTSAHQTVEGNVTPRESPNLAQGFHVNAGDSPVSVTTELLRQVPPLRSEEPEAILKFASRLDEVHQLGLMDDRVFIMRVLPLVSGVMLRFFGGCLKEGKGWKECKADLLVKFFPHFVRERMIRDRITFCFHQEAQPIREFANEVFATAEFLGYDPGEQQLVDRVVMNLHPSVLAHTAFLNRPTSRKELEGAVALMEEKVVVLREREMLQPAAAVLASHDRSKPGQARRVPIGPELRRCWECGRTGHLRHQCRQLTHRSGNGHLPGGR